LPIDTHVARSVWPSARSSASTSGPGLAGSPSSVGIFAGARIGGPMSTRTRSPSQRGVTMPPSVSTVTASFVVWPASRRYFSTQRMPLPHISTWEPSAS
jgi:hypothetical protein